MLFPKPGVATPGVCFAETAGRLDLHRDGKRVLMTLTDAGAVWEIDLASGQMLWEYVYVDPKEPGHKPKILTAKYVENPAFLH